MKNQNKEKKSLADKTDIPDTYKKNKKTRLKDLFLERYKQNYACISLTCEEIGISRDTFYRWRKTDQKFRKRLEEIEESLLDIAEMQLMKNIMDGKETSLIFFLVNRSKGKYQHIQKIEQKFDEETKQKIDSLLEFLSKALKNEKQK